MKASNYHHLLSRLSQMTAQERKLWAELNILPWILKSPEALIRLFVIIFNLLDIIASTFFDKDGKPRDPWWVRLLGAIGISFAKKIRKVGQDADDTIKEMKLPDFL